MEQVINFKNITGIEGPAFAGKSTLMSAVARDAAEMVAIVPEACDVVGGNRNFRKVPFATMEQAQLNTHFFLEVEKIRCDLAANLAAQGDKQVLMDRVTPLSSVMLLVLLKEKFPDLHNFGGYLGYALEQFQHALDDGKIFIPHKLVMVETTAEDFAVRTSRGTSVGAFGRLDVYQATLERYRKVVNGIYPQENQLWVTSRNSDESRIALSQAVIGFLKTNDTRPVPDVDLSRAFEVENETAAPELPVNTVRTEVARVRDLAHRAKYEYLKLDEGMAVRPGSGPDDAAAFKTQMLKTLKKEWGFDYDPNFNHDLDHPDEDYAGKGKYWVVEVNGNIVGTMAAQDEGERVHWRRLSIDPEYRKKGWGWQMLLLIARYSKEAGFKTGYFDTIMDTGVYKMYERIGCKVVAEYPEGQYTKADMEIDLQNAQV